MNNVPFEPKLLCIVDNKDNMERRIKMIKQSWVFKKRKLIIGIISFVIIGVVGALFLTSSISDKIPKLYVSTGNVNIEAIQGGYNWKFGIIFLKSAITDALNPAQMIYDKANTISVDSKEQLMLSNRKYKIDREYEKKAYTVNWYDTDGTPVSMGNLPSDFGNAVPNVIYHTAPDEPGEYICSIKIEYRRGQVEYGFKVIVKEKKEISAFKGLELYVWKSKALTGNDNTYFTLLSGTNRLKTEDEIYDLSVAKTNLDDINTMLSVFSGDGLYLAIFQMNTTDFTKLQMQEISDKIIMPGDNWSKSIGLFEQNSAAAGIEDFVPCLFPAKQLPVLQIKS